MSAGKSAGPWVIVPKDVQPSALYVQLHASSGLTVYLDHADAERASCRPGRWDVRPLADVLREARRQRAQEVREIEDALVTVQSFFIGDEDAEAGGLA